MKKIVLSTLAALSIVTVASASDALYKDANGQVFASPADGRTALDMTTVTSNTPKLDFSMLAYIGFKDTNYREKPGIAGKPDTANFEARRMYFQAKAFMDDNKKNYFRLTYDVYETGAVSTTTNNSSTAGDYYTAQVKYAYLYLDKILPFTDIEIGQAHTTLLDYEEGHSWIYRCIDNVFTEEANGPKFHQSAGRGIDLKTNTQYFSSEIGVYNNAGYHDAETTYQNNGMGMDYQGRFTLHALGTGTDYKPAHTYWDVSALVKYADNKANGAGHGENYGDMLAYGLHTVYNTKPLLVSAQYWNAPNTDKADSSVEVSAYSGTGYSANFDARLGEKDQYHVFGRYDNWKAKKATGTPETAKRTYIGGAAWDMNKNLTWVANFITQDNEKDVTNNTKYMLTAQVSF